MTGLVLFNSYTPESLQLQGFVLPNGVDGWFGRKSETEDYALFFTIRPTNRWCLPPIEDRYLCFFNTPSCIRMGVNCCHNKDDLLGFRTATFGVPAKSSRVHLFASKVTDEWYYLGISILGSGYGTIDSFNQFEFRLSQKLPEWLWVKFGGYRKWLVCTGQDQFLVSNDGDAEYLLLDHWGTISPTLEVTSYQEDSLFAVTNTNGDAVITCHFGDKQLHSVGSGYSSESEEYYGFGNYEFPRSWIIPRKKAITLIRRFLEAGVPIGLAEE